MGGLACATMLAKEGKSVCVLEKNKQIGGTLQTFVRDKIIFDSGVHYVGGLEKGQNLYQFFKYFGIAEKIKIEKLDEDGYDVISFDGDPTLYKHAQGYARFKQKLVEQFPEEEPAIQKYCNLLREVCAKFPLYNLRTGNYFEKMDVLSIDARTMIHSLTTNQTLRNVLSATNILYAGEPDKTPFYVHALVTNSYIEGAFRFVDGGSQIARYLGREITSRGGVIKRYAHVTKLEVEAGQITCAHLKSGEKIYGKLFISNVHPNQTLEWVDSSLIKNAYRNRLKSIPNTTSAFSVNIVLKKNHLEYKKHNRYFLTNEDVWDTIKINSTNWPSVVALYYSASSRSKPYAEAVTLITYMDFEDVKQWSHTFNMVSSERERGQEYQEFKKQRAEKLIDFTVLRFPELKEAICKYYVSTPLTIRDYIGNDDGSLYGFVKDYHDPLKSFISPRTKIPNLLLTGQNINLHGIVGVTVSAVLTCSEVLGMDYLLNKIKNA
jgi:all-trans-retinol 13,14-reductase